MKKDTVVIDVDGCLNHYPDPLKMWAEVTLNLDQLESRQAIKKNNDFDLLKSTYRHSNILNYLLPRDGASSVIKKIKKNGYSITMLTSRNPNKNSGIKAITENWLNRYQIPFDSIVFTKDKGGYVKQHEDRIAMVIEDDPNFFDSFEKLDTKVVAFKNDLTVDIKQAHFHAVSSWREVESLFKRLVIN